MRREAVRRRIGMDAEGPLSRDPACCPARSEVSGPVRAAASLGLVYGGAVFGWFTQRRCWRWRGCTSDGCSGTDCQRRATVRPMARYGRLIVEELP